MLSGSVAQVVRVPLSSAIPIFILYYTGMTATNVDFVGDYVEYGFNPVGLQLAKESVYNELSDIKSGFEGEAKGKKALQVVLDENLINAFLKQFSSMETMYSLKEFVKADPRLHQLLPLMVSNSIGHAVPSFIEEYGEDK